MIKRHPILFLMLVACGFSWGLWLPTIGSSQGWWPWHFSAGPLGSFGPLIAALLLCRYAGVADSRRHFFALSFRRSPEKRWFALAFLLPFILIVAAVFMQLVISGSTPVINQLDQAWMLPLLFVLILVLGGPVGEEFGWRGYVLPLLLRRANPLVASAMLAGCWLLWHLPLFWMEGAAQKGSSLLYFAIMVLACSIMFTWLYLRTGPNLLAVLLLHTSINLWTFVLPYAMPDVEASTWFGRFLVIAFSLTAIVFAFAPDMRKMRD